MNSAELTVLSAVHGDDMWGTVFIIADNLNNFKDIIFLIANISKDRTNPVDLEQNPVTEKDQQDILAKIERQNP